jgi:hypothetical protein
MTIADSWIVFLRVLGQGLCSVVTGGVQQCAAVACTSNTQCCADAAKGPASFSVVRVCCPAAHHAMCPSSLSVGDGQPDCLRGPCHPPGQGSAECRKGVRVHRTVSAATQLVQLGPWVWCVTAQHAQIIHRCAPAGVLLLLCSTQAHRQA